MSKCITQEAFLRLLFLKDRIIIQYNIGNMNTVCSIIKVDYGVNLFNSILLLFDHLAYSKYTLPKGSSSEEYIKHNKKTLTAGCKISWVIRNMNKTCIAYSNGAPILVYIIY